MAASYLLAYAVPALPLAFAALPLYVHLPHFYAAAGLELTVLGWVLLLTRLADAAIDPWLGRLADQLPRRQMILAGLPLFVLGFVGLFHPPSGILLPWLVGCLGLTYFGYSTVSIAYQAWASDFSRQTITLTRLSAAREAAGLCGVLLAATLPAWAGTPQVLAQWLPPLALLAGWLVWRSVWPAAGGPAQPMPFAGWGSLLALPGLRRLLSVFVLNGLASALPATLFLFYCNDVLRAGAASGGLLALYFLAGAASLPLWTALAMRWGRPRAWLLAMALAGLAFAGASQLGAGDLAAFGLICLFSGLALGADLALPAAMASSIGQSSGQSGAVFGLWNLLAKLNLAFAAGLALPLLAWFGYVPGGEFVQPLRWAYALLPLVFKALAAVLLWRWRNSLEVS